MPLARSWDEISAVSRASAVLLLLIPPERDQDPCRILFIRRSSQVRSHRGQIGFPGGRREPSDLSPTQTALREAQEELGIAPEMVNLLGMLPKAKSLDGLPVVPIVGMAPLRLDSLRPEPSEVEDAFAIPWPHFAVSQYEIFSMNIFGIWRQSGVFQTHGVKVWGLTAHVLCTAAFG